MAQTARLTALSNITRAVSALGLFHLARFAHLHTDAILWTRIYWLSSLTTAVVAFCSVTRLLGWPAFARIRARDLTEGFSFSLSSSSISIYNDIDRLFWLARDNCMLQEFTQQLTASLMLPVCQSMPSTLPPRPASSEEANKAWKKHQR